MHSRRVALTLRHVALVALAFAACSEEVAGNGADAPRADTAAPDVAVDGSAPFDAIEDRAAPEDLTAVDATVEDIAAIEDAAVEDAAKIDAPEDVAPRMDVAPRDVSSLIGVRCGVPAPEGAAHALPAPRFSGGACPRLVPGRNTLRTARGDRTFILVVPSASDGSVTPLPLLFGWHWLGGSASGFVDRGALQANADRLRFIAAMPEKKGDLAIGVGSVRFDPVWPYLTYHTAARVEEEAAFFDDMLACISAQYPVDLDCVTSAGVSAGALWTAQLAQVRSERLASAIVLSGGIGPATTLGAGLIDARMWSGARHAMPMMILWGGPIDQCGLNFNIAARHLENAAGRAGHFIEECIHNCGHTVPPVDPAQGLGVIWQFFLDHPYWLARGDSPYLATGLPTSAPSWCAIGAGHATPRVGSCPDPTMSCPVPAL
jgi:predicted esterase